MDHVLIIALLTWGGVFLYLVRLERLTRAVERQVELHHADAEDTQREKEEVR